MCMQALWVTQSVDHLRQWLAPPLHTSVLTVKEWVQPYLMEKDTTTTTQEAGEEQERKERKEGEEEGSSDSSSDDGDNTGGMQMQDTDGGCDCGSLWV